MVDDDRSEGLRLIQANLAKIIPYLEGLESKIKPSFERKGLRFEVGVDVIEAEVSKKIRYEVRVDDSSGEVRAFDVLDLVRNAEPHYSGKAGTISGYLPYPMSAFLNLTFLKDVDLAMKNSPRQMIEELIRKYKVEKVSAAHAKKDFEELCKKYNIE
jgi:hypothetical protein